MKPRQRTRQNRKWLATCQAAHTLAQTMPDELRALAERITYEMCDLGDAKQIPPRLMATAAAAMIGGLVLAEVGGDVHADAAIDDFIYFAQAAMDVAVAEMRIRKGWTPGGKH
jgi:hypothetical protein